MREDVKADKRVRAIAALVTGKTVKQAQERAGISERTFRRWRKDPLFRRVLAEMTRLDVARELGGPRSACSGCPCKALCGMLAGTAQGSAVGDEKAP
jgi:hypothetical protein